MRGITAQYLAPIASWLVIAAVGWLLGLAGWGVGMATLVGVGVAVGLARRTRRKLAAIEAITRRTDADDEIEPLPVVARDEYDETLRAVARFAVGVRRRLRLDANRIAQQALVLDRMNDGLMRVSAEGRVIYANVAAGTLFGGRNPIGRSFIAATRDHELNDALRRCFQTGEEQRHTFEIAGEGRIVDAVLIPLADDPAETLVTLRDITEVNRLQHLRRDFVANVSHELRTPLSTIKILTETLIDIRADDDEAGDYLRKIDAEVDSMTALVRDLLDLTRLESAGGRLSLRVVDIATLAEDVCDRMRPLAESHDVRLDMDFDEEAGSAAVDERRMHQALINLVTNAVAHTPAGGTVTIAARGDSRTVIVEVRDTGSGIPSEDLPRIWERFFKTDRARTGPGTGLGLAIVKHIAQAHGGSVSAQSELGRGSTFTISIPRGSVSNLRPRLEVSGPYVPG